jgi:hypothetical protein
VNHTGVPGPAPPVLPAWTIPEISGPRSQTPRARYPWKLCATSLDTPPGCVRVAWTICATNVDDLRYQRGQARVHATRTLLSCTKHRSIPQMLIHWYESRESVVVRFHAGSTDGGSRPGCAGAVRPV